MAGLRAVLGGLTDLKVPVAWLCKGFEQAQSSSATGLMGHDPVPRWGTRQRNTMRVRLDDRRTPLFLQDRELGFFLHVGMRGEAVYGNRPLTFSGAKAARPAAPLPLRSRHPNARSAWLQGSHSRSDAREARQFAASRH